MIINNGDIFDIGQTVNGVSTFIYLNEKIYYFYDDKIQRFLKLPKITNPGDSNLLQYIKNKATIFIYTQNSKIIIQVYTVYYIIIGNIIT